MKSALTSVCRSALVIAAVVCASCTTAQKQPALTDEQRSQNVASYDKVWSRIKERHFDPAKVGEAWDAKHAELRPRVEQATSMAEYRAATTELIESLHQSHFGLIPGEVYAEIDGPDEKPGGGPTDWSGSPGFELRDLDERAVVTYVEPKSPAARAGVKTGWVLVSADGRSVSKALKKVGHAFEGKNDKGLMTAVALRSLVRGPVGSPLEAEFLDSNDRRVVLSIERDAPAGSPVTFGNLPTLYLDIKSTKIDSRIGYFAFSIWFDPPRVMAELQKAIEACSSCEGFIVDLRGNIGGIGALAMGVGGWFIDKPDLKLGTLITRDSRLNFVLNPRPRPFTRPLAILVDEMSASTSEIFAGGLQDLGRARVFGTRTPGAALPSTVEILPNGDRLQYAFANYISNKGEALEARGVVPDQPIELSRDVLLAGKDAVLDAAVAWISSQPR